jgi:hypothetical protein
MEFMPGQVYKVLSTNGDLAIHGTETYLMITTTFGKNGVYNSILIDLINDHIICKCTYRVDARTTNLMLVSDDLSMELKLRYFS